MAELRESIDESVGVAGKPEAALGVDPVREGVGHDIEVRRHVDPIERAVVAGVDDDGHVLGRDGAHDAAEVAGCAHPAGEHDDRCTHGESPVPGRSPRSRSRRAASLVSRSVALRQRDDERAPLLRRVRRARRVDRAEVRVFVEGGRLEVPGQGHHPAKGLPVAFDAGLERHDLGFPCGRVGRDRSALAACRAGHPQRCQQRDQAARSRSPRARESFRGGHGGRFFATPGPASSARLQT